MGDRKIKLGQYLYDKDRTILQQFDAFPKIIKRVGPSCKRYFYAHIDKARRLQLDSYAPEQEW
jgi:hypothetical protein